MIQEAQAANDTIWFYEESGQRKGPISENEIANLIKSSKIGYGSPVWKKGFPDWIKVENSDLQVYFDDTAPPPLSGEHINNTLVWVLAFAPLIGYCLEALIAGAMNIDNPVGAAVELSNSKYWFIAVGLNIALAYFDEKRLQKAGHNTEKFKGWCWLVPVYLFQRAKFLKQNLAYFIVWIVCLLIVLFG